MLSEFPQSKLPPHPPSSLNTYLMCALRPQGYEVPEHVPILQMGGGISLLSVNEHWEEHGVADEEDGSVVPDDIPVAFLCVELDSKATGIPGGGEYWFVFEGSSLGQLPNTYSKRLNHINICTCFILRNICRQKPIV